MLGAAVVTLAAAGWAAREGLEVRRLHADDAGRAAAVHAAEQEVVGLVSVGSRTTQADLDRLADGATSDFRSELQQQSKALRAALAGEKVTSTGSIVSSGVTSYSAERARVIVAAKGTVENKSSDAAPRSYRLRVDLSRVGGAWLVSDLEFVS